MKHGNIIKTLAAVFALSLVPATATSASAATQPMGPKRLTVIVLQGSGNGTMWMARNNLNVHIDYMDQRANAFPVYATAQFFEWKQTCRSCGMEWVTLGPERVAPRVTYNKRNSVTFSQRKSGAGKFAASYKICIPVPLRPQCTFVHPWTYPIFR